MAQTLLQGTLVPGQWGFQPSQPLLRSFAISWSFAIPTQVGGCGRGVVSGWLCGKCRTGVPGRGNSRDLRVDVTKGVSQGDRSRSKNYLGTRTRKTSSIRQKWRWGGDSREESKTSDSSVT